jgi:hypothetical protein
VGFSSFQHLDPGLANLEKISNGKWQRANGRCPFQIANLKPFEFCHLPFAI